MKIEFYSGVTYRAVKQSLKLVIHEADKLQSDNYFSGMSCGDTLQMDSFNLINY